MTAGATMLNDYLQASRVSLTQSRMQDIDNAITQYMSVNNVLPCPAVLSDTQDSATFGRALTDGLVPAVHQADSTDCYKISTETPGTFNIAGNLPSQSVTPANSTNIVIGAVPTRSLNLPDQEIADGWGNRFIYAVTDYLTVSGTNNPMQGTIALEDSNDNPLVGSTFTPPLWAQYVLLSYGADRAGAYTIAGIQGGVVCPATGLESVNCTLPTAMFRKTLLTSNQKGPNHFDDYVIYHSNLGVTTALPSSIPSGMFAPFLGTSCPSGWQNAATGVNGCPAGSSGLTCCQKQ